MATLAHRIEYCQPLTIILDAEKNPRIKKINGIKGYFHYLKAQ
jgi:hypothetical protein